PSSSSPATVAPTTAPTALAVASAVPNPIASTPAPETVAVPEANAVTETPATPTAASRASLSAADVVDLLQHQGLPLGALDADPAVADPDHLLGQPGQYSSVVRFQDQRLAPLDKQFDLTGGGVVEVFATAADAQRRLTYLQRIGLVVPAARAYDSRRGAVVLRLP